VCPLAGLGHTDNGLDSSQHKLTVAQMNKQVASPLARLGHIDKWAYFVKA